MKLNTLKLFPLLCITILAACESQPIIPDQQTIEDIPPSLTETSASLEEQARTYINLAKNSNSGEDQQTYRVKASKLFIDNNKIQLAKDQLTILNEQSVYDSSINSASPEFSTATILLLSSEIAIAEKNILLTNRLIQKIKPESNDQNLLYLELKANYDYLVTDYMSAVNRRVKLDSLLHDDQEKNRNNHKIWGALSNIPASQLYQLNSKHPITIGWLDLAKIIRSGQKNTSQFDNNLLNWITYHPAHPFAGEFSASLINDFQLDKESIKHIAVLLPMQGDLSKITSTIKNGLLSAYYQDSNSTNKPIINFYDSSDESLTFEQLYQQALDDGATNIVGPINKTTISRLAQQKELDTPVLTLNYSENTLSQTENLFQFGLSPEDEANQVAELAIKQNKRRAAVFYPDSDWGKRLHLAFKKRFEFLGGEVLIATDYATDTNDYRRPIKTLLNLNESAIRRSKVENTLGKKVQSELYRRQDIDMIFLAATHRSARGIMPAFKFHHAGDLPTYATSHVYTGVLDRELDRDLNGLVFCDLPWILRNTSPLSKTFEQNWPQQEKLTRLFALGVDAYHLTNNLDYLSNSDYTYYDGLTGNIQLDNSNRITRNLLWAKFKNGKAVYFEPVANIAPPTTTDRP